MTPPRSPRGRQQDGRTASTSKPPRPRSRPPVLSDGRGPHQESSSTPHRVMPRPPPSTSSPSVGRKQQAETSHGQQSPVPRQQPAFSGRRATQTPNHSKAATPGSSPKNHSAAAELAGDEEESKSQFSVYLKMYNFKTLKDKMNKVPPNSSKGSGGGTQARKSSS